MNLRHLAVAAVAAATATAAQQPFELDPGFRTQFNMNAMGSHPHDIGDILERPDGKIIVSGSFVPPNSDPTVSRGGGLLEPNGAWIPIPNDLYWGLGSKMVPWGTDKFYAGQIFGGVMRFWMDGQVDSSFRNFNSPPDPLVTGGTGADFHVFPDGRVLLVGAVDLADTARAFVGTYGLVWFNSNGRLDTTRIHRSIDPFSTIDRIWALSDGKFLLGGTLWQYDGEPVPHSLVFRVLPDGAMDTTFHGPLTSYGYMEHFLEQPDGKILMTGTFCTEGSPDTLSLVRMMPDGQLDPSFNNHHYYRATYNWGRIALVRQTTLIGENRIAVTGDFDRIDGEVHGGIVMLDMAGNILPGYFEGGGCGSWNFPPPWNFQTPYQFIVGIKPSQDGGYFIYGSYRGYDDGTTNDPSQALMSKLYGLNVGINEHTASPIQPLEIAPNPGNGGAVQLTVGTAPKQATLSIHDASGRMVWQEVWPAGAYTHTLRAGLLAPGTYMLRVQEEEQQTRYSGKLMVLP